jgi:trans-aconitate 2-methyltransferase
LAKKQFDSFSMKGTTSKGVVWSAADYASNSKVQQKWAHELITKLKLHGGERILDVGCGDGKITAEIARAVPQGEAVGVDASPQMIEFAEKAFQLSNLNFRVVDARQIGPKTFSPSPPPKEKRVRVRRPFQTKPLTPLRGGDGDGSISALFDVVFSNAALHWVDDHQAFLRGAASVLRPSGRLIVSCGGKGNAHALARILSQNGSTVFLPQSGGIQKMAAAFWI